MWPAIRYRFCKWSWCVYWQSSSLGYAKPRISRRTRRWTNKGRLRVAPPCDRTQIQQLASRRTPNVAEGSRYMLGWCCRLPAFPFRFQQCIFSSAAFSKMANPITKPEFFVKRVELLLSLNMIILELLAAATARLFTLRDGTESSLQVNPRRARGQRSICMCATVMTSCQRIR